MRITQRSEHSIVKRTVLAVAITAVAISLTACSHARLMLHGTGVKRPAASEFGLGPRASAAGRYVATLEPSNPLRPRKMQTVRVIVRDANGRAIDEVTNNEFHTTGVPPRPELALDHGRLAGATAVLSDESIAAAAGPTRASAAPSSSSS